MVTRDEPALRGAFKQAAQRIIAQRCCAGCAGHCDKSVFDVVGIAVRAVAGQVAVGVVRKAGRASGRILVEAIDPVIAIDRNIAGIGIGVVRRAARGDLAGRVVGEVGALASLVDH